MNMYQIYIISIWRRVQKLFNSSGAGFLFAGKFLMVVLLVGGVKEGRAQEKVDRKVQTTESKRELHNLRQAIVEIHKGPVEDGLNRIPVIEYQVDTTQLGFVTRGESIPDEILDMPLTIINHAEGKNKSTLRELADKKFLVLDFWAKWCKPCIHSMNKWESMKPQIEQDIHVVGVHLDYDYKAQPEVDMRKWTGIQIVGREGYILNRYLCRYYVLGPCAWIKDGKLFGVAKAAPDGYQLQLISGDINEIPQSEIWRPF